MFAITLTKNGNFYKFVGFVNTKEEFEAIAQKFIDKYGEAFLIENGYKINMELAF